MQPVRLLAVFAENKPDQLARITAALAQAQVNIHWVGIADVRKFGVIRFLLDRPDQAFDTLKAHGFTVSFVEVLAVEVQDKPGALHTVTSALSEANLSLDNCSGFVFNRRAILLLETDDLSQARLVIAQQNLHLLSADELINL